MPSTLDRRIKHTILLKKSRYSHINHITALLVRFTCKQDCPKVCWFGVEVFCLNRILLHFPPLNPTWFVIEVMCHSYGHLPFELTFGDELGPTICLDGIRASRSNVGTSISTCSRYLVLGVRGVY